MASESLLETVATHERGLMDDLNSTREEARQLVEAAHAEGAALLQETNSKLDAEVATLRREAAQRRDTERSTIQQETAADVEQMRSRSASMTSAVRDEIVARILPGTD